MCLKINEIKSYCHNTNIKRKRMEINPGINFFRNKGERELWIRLNAERIQYSKKMLNNEELPLGSVSEPHSCMWISGNQLVYDEHCRETPRFSFEELLLTREELLRLEIKREEEEQKKMKEQSSPEEGFGGWKWR